jgi:5-bromo-4-chloroindolyl phosphate hydrolysis protein
MAKEQPIALQDPIWRIQLSSKAQRHRCHEVQKLRTTQFVSIMKPEVLKIIEHWKRINDVDEFKRRIYSTVRDMNTVIRNQPASLSIEGQEEYKWHTIDDTLKAPRIDKLIEKHKSTKYQSNMNKSFDLTQTSIQSVDATSQSPKPRDPKYYMFAESPKQAS